MVNFNNETTITRPRQDIVNFVILQRRQDCIDKLRDYTQSVLQREDEDIAKESEFRANLYALAIEILDMLEKELIKAKDNEGKLIYESADELLIQILEGEKQQLMKAFRIISKLLYVKGLTKSDMKDVTDPESELYDELQGDDE